MSFPELKESKSDVQPPGICLCIFGRSIEEVQEQLLLQSLEGGNRRALTWRSCCCRSYTVYYVPYNSCTNMIKYVCLNNSTGRFLRSCQWRPNAMVVLDLHRSMRRTAKRNDIVRLGRRLESFGHCLPPKNRHLRCSFETLSASTFFEGSSLYIGIG